jgi:hypothetical protein
MPAFIDRVKAGDGSTLWLDFVDYAGALLAGGNVPWLDTAACAAWLRKAQGLLGSDVISLPVSHVCSAWLAAHAPLRATMAAKSRTVFPLKGLLADDALRAHLVELVRALRGTVPGPVFALACASPRLWVADAFRQAHAVEVEVGEDDADSAALYIADFLRAFGEAGVDVLLLEESATSEPGTAADVACYRSVLNVAGHYRWAAGLKVPGGRYAGGEAGFDFVIAPRPLPGAMAGRTVGGEFWEGAAPPELAPNAFRYATIPVRADPERVLERLALLR